MNARRPLFNCIVAPMAAGPMSPADAKAMLAAYHAETLREAADVVAELAQTTDVNVAEYPRYDSRQRLALATAESKLRYMADEAAS